MKSQRTDLRLAEWDRLIAPNVVLTPADRRLASRLATAGRITILETANGLEIEATGWIGVVQLATCSITVVPTLIDAKDLLPTLEIAHGLRLFRRLDTGGSFTVAGTELFDLIAWVLADACDAVARAGVHADYAILDDEVPTVRGRIDTLALVVRRFGQVDKVPCYFDERLRDVAENRWLLRALRIARRATLDATVTTRVKQVTELWEQLCNDDPAEPLALPELTRQTAHYRPALHLARIVCDGAAISDPLQQSGAPGFSFLLNMPRLFEDFVAAVLRRVAPAGISVEEQKRDRSILWLPDQNRSFASVRPDVVLTARDRASLPVDAKYKAYSRDRAATSDVYQTAIYALTIGQHSNVTLPRCLLVYPEKVGSHLAPLRVHVRVRAEALAEVLVVGLSVPDVLAWMRGHSSQTGDAYVAEISELLDRHLARGTAVVC